VPRPQRIRRHAEPLRQLAVHLVAQLAERRVRAVAELVQDAEERILVQLLQPQVHHVRVRKAERLRGGVAAPHQLAQRLGHLAADLLARLPRRPSGTLVPLCAQDVENAVVRHRLPIHGGAEGVEHVLQRRGAPDEVLDGGRREQVALELQVQQHQLAPQERVGVGTVLQPAAHAPGTLGIGE
jgi:hypothetical protein